MWRCLQHPPSCQSCYQCEARPVLADGSAGRATSTQTRQQLRPTPSAGLLVPRYSWLSAAVIPAGLLRFPAGPLTPRSPAGHRIRATALGPALLPSCSDEPCCRRKAGEPNKEAGTSWVSLLKRGTPLSLFYLPSLASLAKGQRTSGFPLWRGRPGFRCSLHPSPSSKLILQVSLGRAYGLHNLQFLMTNPGNQACSPRVLSLTLHC